MPTSPKANPRPTGCLGRTPSLGAGSDSHLVLLERSLCRLVTLNETYNLGYGHQRGRDPLEPQSLRCGPPRAYCPGFLISQVRLLRRLRRFGHELSIVGPLLQSHLGVDLAYDVKRGREIGYEGSRCGGARQDGEAVGQDAGGGWSPGAGGGPQGGADARRRG